MNQMKFKNIVLLVFVALSLCCCKKETTDDPVYDIVTDNAAATLYFHYIFSEAEDAWAQVNSKEYSTTPISYHDGSASKTITFSETEGNKPVITIDYNAYNILTEGTAVVSGSMTISITDKNVYRKANQIARVTLSNLSINQQRITGSCSFTYKPVEGDTNDHYDYTLTGAAIYNQENNLKLITADITNGKYTRIDGGETISPTDDTWTYVSTMKGILRENPDLNYTNTILGMYTGVNGEVIDGMVYFSMNCKTAENGVSSVAISGQPEILYQFHCDQWNVRTESEIK